MIKHNFFVIKKKMYIQTYEKNNDKINKFDKIFTDIIMSKFNFIKNDIDKIKSNLDILKHNDYNAIILQNNKIIKNIDDIKDGIYNIKINGKTKKIKIKIE